MIDPFALDEAGLGEPLSLVKGYSSQWRREIAIDQTLFTLSYVLRPYDVDAAPVDQTLSVVSVVSGIFAVSVEPDDIAGWAAGRYYWDLVVTRISDGAAKIIEAGDFYIFDDAFDRRSHAQIMLSKIESVLQGRADSDVESYTIKSRSITKMSVSDLMKWRDYYTREVRNQSHDTGIFQAPDPDKDTIRVRFTN